MKVEKMAIDGLRFQRGDNNTLLLHIPEYGLVSFSLAACRLALFPVQAAQAPLTLHTYLHVPGALHIGPLLTHQIGQLRSLGVPWIERADGADAPPPPADNITAIHSASKGAPNDKSR